MRDRKSKLPANLPGHTPEPKVHCAIVSFFEKELRMVILPNQEAIGKKAVNMVLDVLESKCNHPWRDPIKYGANQAAQTDMLPRSPYRPDPSCFTAPRAGWPLAFRLPPRITL
jgi:hypothetical protein